MISLEDKYGKCCIVNLLGGRGGESELTKSFQVLKNYSEKKNLI